MKKFLPLILFVFAASWAHSQGTVRGKISDNLGETVIGATVILKSDPSKGTVTDFDGNYSIDIPTSQPDTLIISFIGFQAVKKFVNPKNGEVVIMNIDLLPKDFDLGEVVIEAKANRSGDFYMEKVKKNSATSIDYISNETMRKVGDGQVSSSIQRVTGVSSVGGFVTVRGLADRYVQTAVNGGRIPTLDPFTNNINLDIFPTGLVDNLVITKTGNPDLPGDWTGAFISVETKDYPDKLEVGFKMNFGYNTNATFQDIYASERSSTDWLGWDDGFRDIPDIAPPNNEDFPTFNNGTVPYDQFRYLGIEGYLNSLGITENSLIPVGSELYQLGLVELGYLPPAFFNNDAAVASAIDQYSSDYGTAFFREQLNQELAAIGQAFPNNWTGVDRTGGLNFSSSFTVGNQTKLFGKTFGYNFGFRYATITDADNNGYIGRTLSSRDTDPNSPELPPRQGLAGGADLDTRASRERSNLSALANFSLKLNNNNSISFLFMPNFLGQNRARTGFGLVEDVAEFQDRPEQFYEERRQLIYQLSSQHYVPGSKGTIKFDASYTDGYRNAPNFITELPLFYDNEGGGFPQLLNTSNPTRLYRTLDDDLLDIRASYEFPLFQEMESLAKLKFGGQYMRNERESAQNIFRVQNVTQQPLTQGLNYALRPELFSISRDFGNPLYYINDGNVTDNDIGFKTVYAAFGMIDYNITTRLRAVGGLRVEYTDIFSDIKEFYENDIPFDDDRRVVPGRLSRANPSEIQSTDFLPSVNLIYKLREDLASPMNLRANYFRSLARPAFREISFVRLLDYEYQALVAGNPNLELTTVDNYDLRLENFFKGGHLLSASVFYKDFTNHIELIQIEGGRGPFTWQNAEDSYAVGVELEGVWNAAKSLEFRSNVSIIYSETTVTDENITDTRPMFGQAPWIINAMATHTWEKIGLTSSISYNVQGPKLAAIINAAVAIPDVYEMPRHLIDIKLGKSLGEHFAIDLRVRNLLNSPVRLAYDFEAGRDVQDFSNFAWGTNIIFGIGYQL